MLNMLGFAGQFQALLHLKQLSLFGMISRLHENVLKDVAKYTLITSPDSSNSWFIQIKKICLQYQLSHPLSLLEDPPSKESFKHLTKKKVLQFWEQKLANDVRNLSSLQFFKPDCMSLSTPHPLLTSCGSNSYEINKTIIQLKFLSGRYRCDKLLSYFKPSNLPTCQLNCDNPAAVGDIRHLLIDCSSLATRRNFLYHYWDSIASYNPVVSDLVTTVRLGDADQLLQFLLDCSSLPQVAELCEAYGKGVYFPLFKMSRTFCYSIHRERLKQLNRWSYLIFWYIC